MTKLYIKALQKYNGFGRLLCLMLFIAKSTVIIHQINAYLLSLTLSNTFTAVTPLEMSL